MFIGNGNSKLSSIKRSIKHFSEWGLAWQNAKKENNHYYSFIPPSPFLIFIQYHSSAAVTNKAMPPQCKTGSAGYLCHRQVFQGFVPIPFIFLYLMEIFLLPLTVWKLKDGSGRKSCELLWHLVAMAEVSLQTQQHPCSHSDHLPWARHSFCSTGRATEKAGMHFSVT